MKKQFTLKLVGICIFLSITSCATRSTPPAQVINASQVPAYAQTTITPSPVAATPPPSAPTTAKLEAVTNDEQVKATSVSSAPPQAVISKPPSSNVDNVNKSSWKMPTAGNLGVYTASSKGVDISGTEGQAIYAVSDGKVLYSGNGLKGYGNLIIIRHDNSYLSAYAYNKSNLVKEGAMVQQGQKIATMGHNGSNQAMLHLEVRKNGKPIDPHTMIGN